MKIFRMYREERWARCSVMCPHHFLEFKHVYAHVTCILSRSFSQPFPLSSSPVASRHHRRISVLDEILVALTLDYK